MPLSDSPESKNFHFNTSLIIDCVFWVTSIAISLKIIQLSVTKVESPIPGDLMDKFFHIIAYFALTLSLLLPAAWRPLRGNGPFPNSFLVIFILVSVFGASLEIIQHFIPYRDGSFTDVVANTLGIFFATLMLKKLKKSFENGLIKRNKSTL
jgi:VanZ family protein